MKKFSMNVLKVGVLMMLSICIFGIGLSVDAANVKMDCGKQTTIIKLNSEEGIYGYSVKDSSGKEIENSTNLKGKCNYFKVSLSGTSRLRWESKVFVNNEPRLTTNLSINVTKAGKYTLVITKAKHVKGTWAAWKGDSVTYQITVNEKAKPAPSITIDEDLLSLTEGESGQLKVTVKNANGAKIKWETSNKDVATVDQNGKVHAKEYGTATITAKITIGSKEYKDTCNISVRRKRWVYRNTSRNTNTNTNTNTSRNTNTNTSRNTNTNTRN